MGANPVQDPMPAGGMYLAQDGNIVVGATIRKADNDDNMYYMKIDPVSLQPVPGWGPISYGGPGNEVLTTIAPSPTGGIIMGGAFSVTWPGTPNRRA